MWLFPHQDLYLIKNVSFSFTFPIFFFILHVAEDIAERTKQIKSFSRFFFLTNPPLLKHHHQWLEYLSYTNLFSLYITHSYISFHSTKTWEIKESFEWFNLDLFGLSHSIWGEIQKEEKDLLLLRISTHQTHLRQPQIISTTMLITWQPPSLSYNSHETTNLSYFSPPSDSHLSLTQRKPLYNRP